MRLSMLATQLVLLLESSREKLLDTIYGNATTNLQSNGRGGGI